MPEEAWLNPIDGIRNYFNISVQSKKIQKNASYLIHCMID
jgi:hypothetical protein